MSHVDPVPGRLVWAKLGQWPWWPAMVADFSQVSEEIRATLSAAVSKPKRKELVLVQFLEQPPKYQFLKRESLAPWRLCYAKYSSNRRLGRALAMAKEHEATLSEELASDGNIVVPEDGVEAVEASSNAVPSKGVKRARTDKEKKGEGDAAPKREAIALPLATEAEVREIKAVLGRALREATPLQIVASLAPLRQLAFAPDLVRKMQLGSVAVHVSRHSDPAVAEAGAELVVHIKAQCARHELTEQLRK